VAEADVTAVLKVADRVGVGTMAEVEVGTADEAAVEVTAKTEVGVVADVRIGGASQTGVGATDVAEVGGPSVGSGGRGLVESGVATSAVGIGGRGSLPGCRDVARMVPVPRSPEPRGASLRSSSRRMSLRTNSRVSNRDRKSLRLTISGGRLFRASISTYEASCP